MSLVEKLNDRPTPFAAATAVAVSSPRDEALTCLVLLLRLHGIGLSLDALRQDFVGRDKVEPEDLVRLAQRHGVKARIVRTQRERFEKTPLPAIARDTDGGFFILAGAQAENIVIQRPSVGRPELVPAEAFDQMWAGVLILITRRAGLSTEAGHFGIGWFLSAMHKYRRILVQVLVASFVLQLFALVTPLFFQVVVDKVLVQRGISTLEILIVGLAGVSVFETVLGIFRTYIFSHTTNRIDVELGARLFRHLLGLPLAYFGARRVGDSVARVRELENIRQFITGTSLTLVIDLFFTIVFLGVMAWYSWFLTIIVVLSLPIYAGISILLTPIFRARLDERFARGAENQAFLVEAVTGVEMLKSMAVEPQLQRRWEEQIAGYVASSFNVSQLSNYASQGIQLVSKLVTVLILLFGAEAVIKGDMTVGELVAFNMLAGRLAQPVLRLAQLWQDFHQARLSMLRLGDILNTPMEPSATAGRTALPKLEGAVRFERTRFRYRLDGPEILQGVDFAIPAGQVVGIVGPSGSGKSTVAKLLQRLYLPESGRVLIDGVDLAMVDPGWLRRQIGVVLQENMLMNRTVRENIAITDPGMPIENVVAAAQLAGAHDFILSLQKGYDTVIGERGSTLSGGQRQRIAIARALVINPRILVFDEATSALDYESEAAIQQNMRMICQGRTVIIIAHRLSTVRNCDRILTIEAGRVVEDGSHDQLVRQGGRYAALCRAQGASLHV